MRRDKSGDSKATKIMTRRQQWAMFCMGVWFTGTVLSALLAAENFWTIDKLIEQSNSEPFRRAMETLSPASGREFLRYLASELNRLYFQWWNIAQLGVLVL